MKINYNFNKSSESITCKVESIELEILETPKPLEISQDEFEVALKEDEDFLDFKIEVDFTENPNLNRIISILVSEGWDFELDVEYYDLEKGYEEGNAILEIDNTIYVEFHIAQGSFGNEVSKAKAYKSIKPSIQNKTFNNALELKEYITSITGKVEFISSSSIDEVLLKEWLGEWSYEKKKVLKLKSIKDLELTEALKASYGTGSTLLDCGNYCLDTYEKIYRNHTNIILKEQYSSKDTLLQRQFFEEYEKLEATDTKIGSPKLNSNWIFNIKK